MTGQQEKRAQFVGRMSGWVAVLGVIAIAVTVLKHPGYTSGFGLAVELLTQALTTAAFALLWAMFRHRDALRRALRPKVFGRFRLLAGLIFLGAIAVLPWSFFTQRPAFEVLMAFVCLAGAAVLANSIWLFHAHPEKLARFLTPENR
jgi:hypothetical protein